MCTLMSPYWRFRNFVASFRLRHLLPRLQADMCLPLLGDLEGDGLFIHLFLSTLLSLLALSCHVLGAISPSGAVDTPDESLCSGKNREMWEWMGAGEPN